MRGAPSRVSVRIACGLGLALVTLAATPVTGGQWAAPATPAGLLDAWVGLWGSYDLDLVPVLFLRDDRLTYFSSEREGLIRGFEAVLEHHRGFGFVPGGAARDTSLWVDDVVITDVGAIAVITAIWHFGDPAFPGDAQRGPMTAVAIQATDGYRIAHMNFATYRPQP